MKQLSKIRMAENAEVLSEAEMKQVLGGYGYDNGGCTKVGPTTCSGTCRFGTDNHLGQCMELGGTCYCY